MPDSQFDVFVTVDLRERSVHDRVACRGRSAAGDECARVLADNVTVARMARQYNAVLSPSKIGPIWLPYPPLLFQRNALYFGR